MMEVTVTFVLSVPLVPGLSEKVVSEKVQEVFVGLTPISAIEEKFQEVGLPQLGKHEFNIEVF